MGEVTPIRAPRKLYRPFRVECERCGQEHLVERGGSYRDADYLELFHEHMALQATYKAAIKFMALLMRARNETSHEQAREIERLQRLVE